MEARQKEHRAMGGRTGEMSDRRKAKKREGGKKGDRKGGRQDRSDGRRRE